MEGILSRRQKELRGRADEVTRRAIAPQARDVDHHCIWPAHSLKALGEAELLGLHVPERLHGLEQGLLSLVLVTETIAAGCSSSALVYALHCVGTAVIAAKATHDQEQRYLIPIAAGKHITSLALTEAGTGSHFYSPQTRLESVDGSYFVTGEKRFVTSGTHADSYVISTIGSQPAEPGEFSCLVVDRETPGLQWCETWQALGMRGNSARSMFLKKALIPKDNLLGNQADDLWFAFEVVAPYFLMAMAGVFLGIARAALDLMMEYMRDRRYSHTGERLADIPVLQHRVGELWVEVEKTRYLIYHAAQMGDLGSQDALPTILGAKAEAATLAVRVTDEAMKISGGSAYNENGDLSRLLRDAQAAHALSPTTDLLRVWTGRTLLGLPML